MTIPSWKTRTVVEIDVVMTLLIVVATTVAVLTHAQRLEGLLVGLVIGIVFVNVLYVVDIVVKRRQR